MGQRYRVTYTSKGITSTLLRGFREEAKAEAAAAELRQAGIDARAEAYDSGSQPVRVLGKLAGALALCLALAGGTGCAGGEEPSLPYGTAYRVKAQATLTGDPAPLPDVVSPATAGRLLSLSAGLHRLQQVRLAARGRVR